MTEQPKFRLLTDPNRLGHRNLQAHMDRLVSENLDELNAMQAEAGAPLLADPFENTDETEAPHV
jgi:hypothetical protein